MYSKKSQIAARKIIFYMASAFAITISFLFLAFIITINKAEIARIPVDMENYLLSQRFFNSPTCFALQDKETLRVSQGVIDITKFNQDNLDICYNISNTEVKAFRLTLDHAGSKITLETKNWEGFLDQAEITKVSVYDSGTIGQAEFLIEVQNAK